MPTYSATIALRDDDGNDYSRGFTATYRLKDIAEQHSDVFTFAQGRGYDTETGATEPVVVIQGYAEDATNVWLELANYAKHTLNQRAIGWFVSTDSYRETSCS